MIPMDESDEESSSPRLPDGWRVIDGPTRNPVAQDGELKQIIQDQQRSSESAKRKRYRRLGPPDAA